MDPNHIRNFAIIAHIDHGKSTLSDRLLELTGSVTAREMHAQVLDAMDLERERGITIKAHTVRMMYKAHDGETYQLNLIDTPGHVDFSYEVSRSLASCEGALLVVDASQGVEAQTLANAYLALNHGLEIISIINKIDLPSADIERAREMIEKAVGLPADDALAVSAKTGAGVADILEAVVERLPPPRGDADAPLQALIFDSWFDPYRGVIVLARIINGRLRQGMKIKIMSNGKQFDVESMGVMTPKPIALTELSAGEVGFFVATIKNVADTKVGDTITEVARPCAEALPGFEDIKSMVFAGLYTVDSHEHAMLRDALEKLRLNDASFSFEPESSVALGFGFRCGFLGLLHLEIIQERLEREYNLDLITTAPGVRYQITKTDGAAGCAAGSIELEARGGIGDRAGRQHAGAANGRSAEAGRIAIGAVAGGLTAGSLGGLHGSESNPQPGGPGDSDLGSDTGLPLPGVCGSVQHHGRPGFGIAERFRFQLHPAFPGVEGGCERGQGGYQWKRGAGGGTGSARLSGGGAGGRGRGGGAG